MLARPELGNKAFRSVRIVWMAAEREYARQDQKETKETRDRN